MKKQATGNESPKKNSKQLFATLCILVFVVGFATLLIHQAHASGISVATTAYVSLNLQTLDEQGNVLSGTTIYLNGTAYQTVNGQLQLTNLFPGTAYQGSVTWQGVDVNASFSIVMNQNTTLNISCTAYPFTLNSVLYELATDRPVISDTWDGTHFTIFFGASSTSNMLVFDSSQVPTYITGFSYDLSSDWNSNTDVFTCTISNSTSQATINFDSWGGGFYLQEVDTPIASASWTGQTFTIQLETNGTGTLIIHCSTRGVPTTVSGMVAVYDSTTTYLTGTYTDNAQIIIDWTQTSPTTGGSGGSSEAALCRLQYHRQVSAQSHWALTKQSTYPSPSPAPASQ